MLSMGLEHLADEPGGCPVAHNDLSAGAADTLQFGCHPFGARGEHGANQADHEFERTVLIGEHFRVALIEMSIQVFSLCTRAGLLDQIRCDINTCDFCPSPCGRDGDLTGAASYIQDAHAWLQGSGRPG